LVEDWTWVGEIHTQEETQNTIEIMAQREPALGGYVKKVQKKASVSKARRDDWPWTGLGTSLRVESQGDSTCDPLRTLGAEPWCGL